MLLIGRGYTFANCLEGALKIKELTYIHAEASARRARGVAACRVFRVVHAPCVPVPPGLLSLPAPVSRSRALNGGGDAAGNHTPGVVAALGPFRGRGQNKLTPCRLCSRPAPQAILAGELKHGPLALIEPAMPIIMMIVKDSSYAKSINAKRQAAQAARDNNTDEEGLTALHQRVWTDPRVVFTRPRHILATY